MPRFYGIPGFTAIQFGALRNRVAVAGARGIERFAHWHADVIAGPTHQACSA